MVISVVIFFQLLKKIRKRPGTLYTCSVSAGMSSSEILSARPEDVEAGSTDCELSFWAGLASLNSSIFSMYLVMIFP